MIIRSYNLVILIIILFSFPTLRFIQPVYNVITQPTFLVLQPSFSSASYITEYPTLGLGPYSIAAGTNHTLWFTEYYTGQVDSLNSETGIVHNYTIPELNAQPVGLAVDRENMVWIADENGHGKVWLFDPINQTFIRTYSGKTNVNATDFFVVTDSSNNVWFSELTGNNIGEIPHGSRLVNEYPLPNPNSGPSVLSIQNGTSYLWVSEYYANKIGRFDMVAHTWTEYNPSPSLKSPLGLALDSSGNIWIAEHGGSSVDQYIVSNSTLRKYPTANAAGNQTAPATVAVDSEGRVWFVEHVSNKVGRYDPKTRTTDEFVFPSSSYSLQGFGSTLDSNGNFWFTLFSNNMVGVIHNNVTSPFKVQVQNSPSKPVTGGNTLTMTFQITDTSTSPFTISLSGTSTFGTAGQFSLSTSSATITSTQNETFSSTVNPDTFTDPGIYIVGLVVTSGNISSIGMAFVSVSPSLAYSLRTYLLEIVLLVAVSAMIVFIRIFLFKNMCQRRNRSTARATPKISLALTVIMAITVGIVPVTTVQAKCPGLPQPPVSPGGGPAPIDYYGIGLDVATAAFFGAIAYLLIRDRLKRRKASPDPPPV